MVLGLKERVRRILFKKEVPQSRTFRDLVIETARNATINGSRQTVPLHGNGDYGQLFSQAKALVMERYHDYLLKEAWIFEQAARIVLAGVPRFRNLRAYTNQFCLPEGKGWEVRLYLR